MTPDELKSVLKKGTLLLVKSPPYYKDEYFYEVLSAGEKTVRAALYHSPKVRKSWNPEELRIMFEMGVIRLAKEGELPPGFPAPSTNQPG